jgi:hypothetical protein
MDDYTTWSVAELRNALADMGLGEKAESVVEKSELVDMMIMWTKILGKSPNRPKDTNKTDKSEEKGSEKVNPPPGHYRLCSRQRHDGIVQSPPVLSDKCKVSKNRVESFTGPIEELEKWLYTHGDRRRFYGAYDSEKNYCFGLIWKDNKYWARAGKHDY